MIYEKEQIFCERNFGFHNRNLTVYMIARSTKETIKAPTLYLTSALDWSGWSKSDPGLFASWKKPCTHLAET
jgi:hypothetical protein